MTSLGLEKDLVDPATYRRAVARFRQAGIRLPTFAELADPSAIPPGVRAALDGVDPDAPHALNLFRAHWYNGADRRAPVSVPEHLLLPEALTGVETPIVVLLGDRFPMIASHKVLAAYACLAPRIVSGQFDPAGQRAVWPSTGNYARGGIAISRLMGCRGIAVLPEGMSRERFAWLERWVADPADIIRTPGTESNVKEIYDRCDALAREPDAVVFNQFREFGNYLAHYLCTGRAVDTVVDTLRRARPEVRVRAFVAATGSAGTLAAGDYLKARHGCLTVAAEALECPTMLYNGFGEHNIQGIGDKHIPLIHNVMATDAVTAISDVSTDRLNVLFNTDAGRAYLAERRGVGDEVLEGLTALGLSGICNVLAAIKTVKAYGWGRDDLVATVATDGAAMYASEREKVLRRDFPRGFDRVAAAETFGACLAGLAADHFLECTHADRTRIFNLGYFTWVEQRGVPLEVFEARRDSRFWTEVRAMGPVWDAMIRRFNADTGVTVGG
jgi:cysteine synthase